MEKKINAWERTDYLVRWQKIHRSKKNLYIFRNMRKIRNMVKEYLNGLMVGNILEHGFRVKSINILIGR